MHLQFILDGRDISGDPYARVDADEVRAWDGETLILAVTDTARNGELAARWTYAGSDVGHTYTDDQLNATYEGWQDAFDAFKIVRLRGGRAVRLGPPATA